jgi:hypothetical protein
LAAFHKAVYGKRRLGVKGMVWIFEPLGTCDNEGLVKERQGGKIIGFFGVEVAVCEAFFRLRKFFCWRTQLACN